MLNTMRERLLFLYKFTRFPKQIGSVTPSSVFLARGMLGQVPWDRVRNVAELGAGTGAITKYISSYTKSGTRVLLFEKDETLRNALQFRYPDYSCHVDACDMTGALAERGMEPGQLDCILSGLPFFNFPQPLRERLMQQIDSALKPGGLFIAFQYSQQMRKQLDARFELEQIRFVPINVPPAFVYVCRKKRDGESSVTFEQTHATIAAVKIAGHEQ
ncbi:class I SAM-dependent methyltransferase [Paenibacillus hodogayensis]|uniref:Class I SAM-dependent methyltransferase n=1 Tax=Paenibacillus hodogayensis TaxID=279208 RepID=A0ABV5VZX1_9BACL